MDINLQLSEAIFKFSRYMSLRIHAQSHFESLSMLQIQTLVYIKKHPNSQMSDIANDFQIELPSATSLISKLVKAKLVARKADAKDRRLVRVTLTNQGEIMLEEARKEKGKQIAKSLDYLSQDDKKILLDIFQKLIKKMEETHEK